MVAGDLVNTASRIQSIAEPGCVLVGEATRRATDQTIVYADAGSHELKGKVGLVPLWQALRVVSGARGALKSTGLEAAVRRSRRRAAPHQGSLPHLRRRAQAAADLDHRHRGHRQVAPRLGVLQVLRRAAPDHVLAPGPLPLLRRGRHVLGARRHGAHAGADRRGRGAGLGAREARRGRRGAPARPRGAPLRRAAPRPPARPRGGHALRAGGPVRGLAAVHRAAG